MRYRPCVVDKTDNDDVIMRLADSGEKAILRLVTLPLRMFLGTLDVVEAQVHKVAEALRDVPQLDERVVELERRVASLETEAPARDRATTPKPTTP
jgi:hypothetical protein